MSTRYMVETQIKPRGVRDDLVLRAMEKVPRDRFVPDGYKNLAFSDCPLPLSCGQTISQPYMVAEMTALLEVDSEARILEIGTGSGYQTAVLAEIVAQVFTVEVLPELATNAHTLLDSLHFDNIQYRVGDGHLGWPEKGPFDGIIVTAAPEKIPPALPAQLKVGARLVIPVGPTAALQELLVIEKLPNQKLRSRSVMPVRFVPLVNRPVSPKEN